MVKMILVFSGILVGFPWIAVLPEIGGTEFGQKANPWRTLEVHIWLARTMELFAESI